jgi:hypothetical protein
MNEDLIFKDPTKEEETKVSKRTYYLRVFLIICALLGVEKLIQPTTERVRKISVSPNPIVVIPTQNPKTWPMPTERNLVLKCITQSTGEENESE